MIQVNLIVARSQNGVIGKDGKIPWHIPEDFRMFQRATSGDAVVMGRKTWESLPGPLKNRLNIIVTSADERTFGKDAVVVRSLHEARTFASQLGYGKLWVIGGELLYRESLVIVDEMHITEVKMNVPHTLDDNVAKFKVDLDRQRWVQTRNTHVNADINHPAYTFDIWKRRSKPYLYQNDILVNEP